MATSLRICERALSFQSKGELLDVLRYMIVLFILEDVGAGWGLMISEYPLSAKSV